MVKNEISKGNAIRFYNILLKKNKQITGLGPTPPREKMLEIFEYLKEIFDGPKTNDTQLDITDMLDLESEESAAERRKKIGQGLKVLTPSQIFSSIKCTK